MQAILYDAGAERRLADYLRAADILGSHAAKAVGLAIWDALPADERATIEARATQRRDPRDVARRMTEEELRGCIADFTERIPEERGARSSRCSGGAGHTGPNCGTARARTCRWCG